MRVLVVDDSDALRARLAQLLREVCGHDGVREARDADEAVEVVVAFLPHVVVLDLHMPGKSGLAVLPSIKASVAAPLVIVLTNDPSEQNRRKATAGGADHFLDKSAEFSRVVDLVVEHGRMRAERP